MDAALTLRKILWLNDPGLSLEKLADAEEVLARYAIYEIPLPEYTIQRLKNYPVAIRAGARHLQPTEK